MMCTSTSGARLRLSALVGVAALSLVAPDAGAQQITFSNVSTAAGITKRTVSYGVSWGDVNGDGHPDVFLNNHANKSSIFLNNGSGLFTDAIKSLDPESYLTGIGAKDDTHGGAWVDFDNDGDQDLVVSTGIKYNVQFFVNIGGKLYYRPTEYGFAYDADQGGRMPLWFDWNRDGLLDTTLLTLYGAPLFTQQSDGTFLDSRGGTGFACNDNQYGVLIDLDGDGRLDLVCVKSGGAFAQAWSMATKPWKNLTSMLPGTTNVNDVVVGDFDNNQRNDMLLLSGALRPSQAVTFNGNRIEAQWINKDRGITFKSSGVLSVTIDWSKTLYQDNDPAASTSSIFIGQNGVHPTTLHFNLDPNDASTHGIKPRNLNATNGEIYIGYDPATQTWSFKQYWNNKYVYTYLGIQSTTAISGMVSTGILAFDGPHYPVLLSNQATGIVDRTSASNLMTKINCLSGVAADLDNDMDMDLFLVCRNGVENIADILLMNDGQGRFTPVANAGGAAGPIGVSVGQDAGAGESVACADYDLDGRIDLFVTNGLNRRPLGTAHQGPYQLFRNTSPVRNWIELDLVGTRSSSGNSSRDAIGATVKATAGGVTQYREQNEGYHRWSQNQRRIHFGLANNATVNVTVNWPSGRVSTFSNVAANNVYVVTEGGSIQQAPY
jgi:hypothetical protein